MWHSRTAAYILRDIQIQTDGRQATTRKFRSGSESSSIFSDPSTTSAPRSWFGLLYKGARVAERLWFIQHLQTWTSTGILHNPSAPKCSLSLEKNLSFKGKERALLTWPFLKFFKLEFKIISLLRGCTEFQPLSFGIFCHNRVTVKKARQNKGLIFPLWNWVIIICAIVRRSWVKPRGVTGAHGTVFTGFCVFSLQTSLLVCDVTQQINIYCC